MRLGGWCIRGGDSLRVIQEEPCDKPGIRFLLNLFFMPTGNYFVYITTNPTKTVLYTGVTNDLYTRMLQYRQNKGKSTSFTGKFYCYILIYHEKFPYANMAIEREKEIKDMSREQKEKLINSINPDWYKLRV
jgi:putative endonuclease